MKKGIKINFVDFWSGFDIKNSLIYKILSKHYHIILSKKPDFLFCGCFGNNHFNYKNVVKIFDTGENVLPDFNLYDYAVGFDYLNFGDCYFRKSYRFPLPNIQDRSFVTPKLLNRKFCNFIYSNAHMGEGAKLRQEFCKKLMKYKHVDCPGPILHNMDAPDLEPRNGDWRRSKINFLKRYKFTIAFENSLSDGYTTEKLIDPLLAGSVPIYYGNNLVKRDFNKRAFIHASDVDNDLDKLVQRVIKLDVNPDLYLKTVATPPMQPNYDRILEFEKWLLHIIEKGNKPFNKDPFEYAKVFHGTSNDYFEWKFLGIPLFVYKHRGNKNSVRFLGIKFSMKKGHKNA